MKEKNRQFCEWWCESVELSLHEPNLKVMFFVSEGNKRWRTLNQSELDKFCFEIMLIF